MKSKNNYYLQNETHTSKNQENLAVIKKRVIKYRLEGKEGP